MLKEVVAQYIKRELASAHNNEVVLYHEELNYAQTRGLLTGELSDSFILKEKTPITRFNSAYIERCDKETENVIEKVENQFLNEQIHFLAKHKNEFVYLESEWFEKLGVDGVALELDDVFGTYDVMFGISLDKKEGPKIKEYLETHLHGDEVKFDLMYSGQERLWNVNFTLNYLKDFHGDMSIGDAYVYIYRLLFNLVAALEENIQ